MSKQTPRTVLAISGSLRQQSSNSYLLKAVAALAPSSVTFVFYEGLEELPPFNPDKSPEVAAVLFFRQQLAAADGVIFCTPEYAFGIPGVLKNALDWVVSTGEFNEKPVAAITASPLTSGGDKAMASLLHTLTALGTRKNDGSSLCIAAIKKKMNEEGELTDEATRAALQRLLNNLLVLIG